LLRKHLVDGLAVGPGGEGVVVADKGAVAGSRHPGHGHERRQRHHGGAGKVEQAVTKGQADRLWVIEGGGPGSTPPPFVYEFTL